MDDLAALCTNYSALLKSLPQGNEALRLRCLCAIFVGMQNNVHRFQQSLANNASSMTTRMTEWTADTVREAKVLMKRLKEEPRQLGFLASFMGFCATRDIDEQKEKLDDLLHTVLCRAFLIQIAIYCEEATMVVDTMPGASVRSARQEFLGCVFDLKERIAASVDHSDQAYKQMVFQISEEYQNRQDERTVAGKRAFIRWHKAANDMIKSQLQQKLSEREKTIMTKEEEMQKMKDDMSKAEKEKTDLRAQIEHDRTISQQRVSDELQTVMQQNADLKLQLDGKATVELSLESHKQKTERLEQDLKAKDVEIVEHRASLEESKQQLEMLQRRIEETEAFLKKEREDVDSLRHMVEEKESKLVEAKKKVSTLTDQVKAKQTENATIVQSVSKLVEENGGLKTQTRDHESKLKGAEKDVKSLRGQLKEKQESVNELLEKNIELENTCQSVEEQMSQKEQQLLELENRFTDLEEESRRALQEKQEQMDSLNQKVETLTVSLDSTKKKLQATRLELEELR